MQRFSVALLVFFLALTTVGCQQGDDAQDELVIYSGRSKALVDSLVDQYRDQVDQPIRVRYGQDSQLLAAIQEEGDQSPADVFWANTTGALSNAAQNDLLTTLPDTLVDRPARFSPSNGRWIPVTTRFRVLAYNRDAVDSTALPSSVLDLPEMDGMEGRIGWTPAYSSFQDFVTALRVLEGDETAQEWIQGVEALNPKAYTSNTPMIRALAAGEIDVALTNHYYVLRMKHGDAKAAASNPGAPVATYHFAEGDIGNLALVTGAGVLSTTDQADDAHRFLRFLLSQDAQAYAAQSVNEYPVLSGTEIPAYMLPLDSALRLSPDFDFDALENQDDTLDFLRNEGLL